MKSTNRTAVLYDLTPLMLFPVTRGPHSKHGFTNSILKTKSAAWVPSGQKVEKKDDPAHTGVTSTADTLHLGMQQFSFFPSEKFANFPSPLEVVQRTSEQTRWREAEVRVSGVEAATITVKMRKTRKQISHL